MTRRVTVTISIVDTSPEVKDNYGKVTEPSKVSRPLDVTLEADTVLEAQGKVIGLLNVYVEGDRG